MAYRFEYADGLRVTMLLMEGLVHDITVAARLENQRDPLSLLFYLGSGHAIQPNSFNPLCRHIRTYDCHRSAALPGWANASDDRVTMAGIESLWLEQKPLDTPHLAIEYQVDRESTFVKT